jgi:hypothetical protein
MSWFRHSLYWLLVAMWFGAVNSSNSCQLNNAELMKQRRMQTLRNSILAQLGVSDPSPANNTEPLPGEEEMKETFNALRSASASLEREKETRCHSDDFYAKPVSSFVGFMSDELFGGGRMRREEAEAVPHTNNLLHSYSITFNFSLPSTLTDVSRADLLLYQQNSVTPDTVVKDRRQYVEIRTVLESLSQKFIVEGKYIDIYETGYQVFEITSAVKLWIARRIEGPVTMEVNVYCYSSPNCSQPDGGDLSPASVSFFSSQAEQDKAPRIITVSKNPLDVQHQERKRRNADELTGVGKCSANQSTCCLKNFQLNFHDDLGLSFILLPENFTANYCEGVCPEIMGGQLMTPRIFELFSRLPETNPGSSVEPCCTGNQYKPLEVLVRKDGELFIEELSHVTVLSCRCT